LRLYIVTATPAYLAFQRRDPSYVSVPVVANQAPAAVAA
jgi:hypothetical protein